MTQKHQKHGYSTGGISKIYRRWYQMNERCRNPKHPDYKYYGGRGIRVCKRWQSSIKNFISDMGMPKEGMTLERINNNRGYSKANCKWASRWVQSRNKRNSALILFDAQLKIAKDISKITGEKPHTIWQRDRRRKKKLSVL